MGTQRASSKSVTVVQMPPKKSGKKADKKSDKKADKRSGTKTETIEQEDDFGIVMRPAQFLRSC